MTEKQEWRPKGWRNPYRIEIVNSSLGGDSTAFSAYEAGADAILEELRKLGVDNATYIHGANLVSPKGKWVFIPDEVRK